METVLLPSFAKTVTSYFNEGAALSDLLRVLIREAPLEQLPGIIQVLQEELEKRKGENDHLKAISRAPAVGRPNAGMIGGTEWIATARQAGKILDDMHARTKAEEKHPEESYFAPTGSSLLSHASSSSDVYQSVSGSPETTPEKKPTGRPFQEINLTMFDSCDYCCGVRVEYDCPNCDEGYEEKIKKMREEGLPTSRSELEERLTKDLGIKIVCGTCSKCLNTTFNGLCESCDGKLYCKISSTVNDLRAVLHKLTFGVCSHCGGETVDGVCPKDSSGEYDRLMLRYRDLDVVTKKQLSDEELRLRESVEKGLRAKLIAMLRVPGRGRKSKPAESK